MCPKCTFIFKAKNISSAKVLGPPVVPKIEAELEGHDFYKVNYDRETLSEEEISQLKQVSSKLEFPTFRGQRFPKRFAPCTTRGECLQAL